jgi:hypothetical protein
MEFGRLSHIKRAVHAELKDEMAFSTLAFVGYSATSNVKTFGFPCCQMCDIGRIHIESVPSFRKSRVTAETGAYSSVTALPSQLSRIFSIDSLTTSAVRSGSVSPEHRH